MSDQPFEPDAETETLDADEALRNLSDEDWRWSHGYLASLDVIPAEELAYTWHPGTSAEALGLIYPDETIWSIETFNAPPILEEHDLSVVDLAEAVSSLNSKQAKAIIARIRSKDVIVREMPGCRTRGRSWTFRPRCCLAHHDAASLKAGQWGSLGYGLTADIAPLAQVWTARCISPVNVPMIAWLADGGANHGGKGGPGGPPGSGLLAGIGTDLVNPLGYGIEQANNGVGEPYNAAHVYARRVTEWAILDVVANGNTKMLAGHKEWTWKTGRKVDPLYNVQNDRIGVVRLQQKPPKPPPAPPPPPVPVPVPVPATLQGDPKMFLAKLADRAAQWLFTDVDKVKIPDGLSYHALDGTDIPNAGVVSPEFMALWPDRVVPVPVTPVALAGEDENQDKD